MCNICKKVHVYHNICIIVIINNKLQSSITSLFNEIVLSLYNDSYTLRAILKIMVIFLWQFQHHNCTIRTAVNTILHCDIVVQLLLHCVPAFFVTGICIFVIHITTCRGLRRKDNRKTELYYRGLYKVSFIF